VALLLSEYRDKGFVLATTEAGLLPLYSGWRSVDAWGLNDQWIAHNGRVTEQYIDRFRPEVIMFHAFFSPPVPPAGSGEWFQTVMVLKAYAEARSYVLAAAFGISPYETHYYYVRRDFPESAEIVKQIRGIDYWWLRQRAFNFASVGCFLQGNAAPNTGD
jgi:hypothetical protein